MNSPQRTACLAKGCINNQYQLTILRKWAAQWLTSLDVRCRTTQAGKQPVSLSNSYVWPVLLPENNTLDQCPMLITRATPDPSVQNVDHWASGVISQYHLILHHFQDFDMPLIIPVDQHWLNIDQGCPDMQILQTTTQRNFGPWNKATYPYFFNVQVNNPNSNSYWYPMYVWGSVRGGLRSLLLFEPTCACLHGGLLCVTFCPSVCPFVCHWIIIHISESIIAMNLKLCHSIEPL